MRTRFIREFLCILNAYHEFLRFQGMEFVVNAIGFEPFFMEQNGELAGFELDSLRIMAEHVKATIKAKKIYFWFDLTYDENNTIVLDKDGNYIFRGTKAEITYQRATFGVAEHTFSGFLYDKIDYLFLSTQTYYLRAPKPQVKIS